MRNTEHRGAAVAMRILGGIVGAYALFTAWGCATVLILRAGGTPPIMPDAKTMGSFVPVLMMLPNWQMLLWIAAALLYAIAAVRMLSGGRGAALYTIALGCDLTFLLFLKLAGAVHADPNTVDLDYVTAVITVTLCGVIWAVERAAYGPKISATQVARA